MHSGTCTSCDRRPSPTIAHNAYIRIHRDRILPRTAVCVSFSILARSRTGFSRELIPAGLYPQNRRRALINALHAQDDGPYLQHDDPADEVSLPLVLDLSVHRVAAARKLHRHYVIEFVITGNNTGFANPIPPRSRSIRTPYLAPCTAPSIFHLRNSVFVCARTHKNGAEAQSTSTPRSTDSPDTAHAYRCCTSTYSCLRSRRVPKAADTLQVSVAACSVGRFPKTPSGIATSEPLARD